MSTKKKKSPAILILILLCINIWTPNFAQYQVPGFSAAIQKAMNLTPAQFSKIATAPLIPGIFLSLCSGILVDRFGAKRILSLGTIISAAALILRVFTTGFWSMYFVAIFIGVNATFLNSNYSKLIGQWFPPEKIPAAMGIFLAFANAGISLGTGTVSFFSGMKQGFTFTAVVASVITVLWVMFMRDNEEAAAQLKQEKQEPVLAGVKVAGKSKTVWLCAACMFLSIGAITTMSNFMPGALMSRGLTERQSTVVTMSLMLGGLVGCFAGPMIARKLNRQRLFFLVGGILAALGMFVFWRISTNPVVLFVLLFISGLACNGMSPVIMSMPVQDKKIGVRYAGTAGGFIATLQLGCSVIVPSYVIAPIATAADGTANYPLLFSLYGILILMFLVVSQFLPDNSKT